MKPQIEALYMRAWQAGLKGITTYRPNEITDGQRRPFEVFINAKNMGIMLGQWR